MKIAVLAAVVALLGLMIFADASSAEIHFRGIGGKLALVLPEGEADNTFGLGAVADLGDIIDQLNLEASAEYWGDSSDVLGVEWSWSAITFGGTAKYHIPMNSGISPFAGGGVGLTISRVEFDAPMVAGVSTSESDTDLSFHGVIGIDIPIAPSVKLTLEAKHVMNGINVTWLTGAVLFRLQ